MPHPVSSQVDERLLRALGHPARQRVLTLLNERVATSVEIARDLDIPQREVEEHLRVLVENDAVEAGDAQESPATWYRATIRPFLDDEHWARLPLDARRALFAQTIQQIVEHIAAALAEDGFDDPRAHVSLTRVELDRRGWNEVADVLAGVLEEIMDIHSESVDRVTRGESEGMVSAELAVLLFERASRAARDEIGGTST
jgi:DNA-binding transcriptional ArsR family regulator